MAREAPTPQYTFRGHQATIHSVTFFNQDANFVSADANGMIIIWDMKTRRPCMSWKAHTKSCLYVGVHNQTLISQGRDHCIHVWQLPLVFDDQSLTSPPDLVHTIPFDATTFFKISLGTVRGNTVICLPSYRHVGHVDLYDLDKQDYLYKEIGDDTNRGVCMAARLWEDTDAGVVGLVAGYEDGCVILWKATIANDADTGADTDTMVWQISWQRQNHTDPVLDLALYDQTERWVVSTSADNQLSKYTMDGLAVLSTKVKKSGLAAVTIRSDGKIFATGGYDGRIRVFSGKTLRPLAVLSYDRDSVYAVAFSSDQSPGRDHWLIGGGKDTRLSLWKIY